MATVRLHTQHHSTGGLRPATPTCCCCSCCCVGATVGTLAILPVMIVRTEIDRQHLPAPSPEPAGDLGGEPPVVVPAPRPGPGPWGAGVMAFVLAAVPFGLAVLLEPNILAVFVAFALSALGLMVWAAVRANAAGRPVWPALTSALVVLPVAFIVEFYYGIEMLSGDGSGYWILATAIGAAVFGLGFAFMVKARQA